MDGMSGVGQEWNRQVRREDLAAYGLLVSVAAVARDAGLRVFWCNEAYCRLCQRPIEQLLGTTPYDLLSPAAAEERAEAMREVIRSGAPQRLLQFGADRRLLCVLLPLDATSFGHAGLLALAQEAPASATLDPGSLPMLSTPCLDDLAALTLRELELLYWVARGLASAEIASQVYRSARTIDKHLEAIHRKLGTGSRAELVRFAVERGVQGFAPEEWRRIVEGAGRVRRAARPGRGVARAGAVVRSAPPAHPIG